MAHNHVEDRLPGNGSGDASWQRISLAIAVFILVLTVGLVATNWVTFVSSS